MNAKQCRYSKIGVQIKLALLRKYQSESMQLNASNLSSHAADETYAKLCRLFAHLPLSDKDKRKWAEARKSDKLLALIALHNPGLRDNLPRNSQQLSKEIALPVSRENQQFDTLMGNLDAFLAQNPKALFSDFLCLDKKTGSATTLDLFSLSMAAEPLNKGVPSELEELKSLEKHYSAAMSISEKMWHAFVVFKQLQKTPGYKKQGALYAEFLFSSLERQLISFPLVVLNTYNWVKHTKEKTFAGRRAGFAGFEEINKEDFLQNFNTILDKTYTELISFYRSIIRFEQLDVYSKIRINFLIDQGFALPQIKENGFTLQNEAVRALCTYGGLRTEDMKKEGALLLAEVLENQMWLVRSEEGDTMDWVINLSQKETHWSQYNRMPFIEKAKFPITTVEEVVAIVPEPDLKPNRAKEQQPQPTVQNSLLWI